jgi:hypothetical protein
MLSFIQNAFRKILIYGTLIALTSYALISHQAHQICQRFTTPETINYESQTIIIPLEEVNEKYFVNVTINGKGPFKLQLDSGSMVTVLHERVIKAAGIRQPLQLQLLHHENNNKAYVVDKLKIGIVSFENYNVQSDTNFNQFGEDDGVLALSAFKDKLITINLSAKYVKLSDGQLSISDKSITPLKETTYKVCIPFLHCAKSKGIRPEATFAYVENHKKMNIDFLIDTGAQRSSIAINRPSDLSRIKYDLIKKYENDINFVDFTFYGVQVKTKAARLQGQFYWNEKFMITKPYAQVIVGPYTPLDKRRKENINISALGDNFVNIIGTSVLKKMIITLDAKNNLMQMLPAEKTTPY